MSLFGLKDVSFFYLCRNEIRVTVILHFIIIICIYFFLLYKCDWQTFCLSSGAQSSLCRHKIASCEEGKKRNSLTANDFSFFQNGWKVIPCELLQHRRIVLTALSLIVPIFFIYLFFFPVLGVPTGVSWGGAKAVSETLLVLNELKLNWWQCWASSTINIQKFLYDLKEELLCITVKHGNTNWFRSKGGWCDY